MYQNVSPLHNKRMTLLKLGKRASLKIIELSISSAHHHDQEEKYHPQSGYPILSRKGCDSYPHMPLWPLILIFWDFPDLDQFITLLSLTLVCWTRIGKQLNVAKEFECHWAITTIKIPFLMSLQCGPINFFSCPQGLCPSLNSAPKSSHCAPTHFSARLTPGMECGFHLIVICWY